MPLEHVLPAAEKAQIVAAAVLEGTTVRAHPILGGPEPGFSAFLDGVQSSRVVAHLDGVPFILGSVAAIVRQRRDRRLSTALYAAADALFVPRRLVPGFRWDETGDIALVDTSAPNGGSNGGAADPILPHPIALGELAYAAIRRRREELEVDLAERWCLGPENGPLFLDGSIAGSPTVAIAARAVGVVKTHRVLYGDGAAIRAVLGLEQGERSSIMRLTAKQLWPAGMGSVATWYLRIRDPEGRDPLWGLVRVEIAEAGATSDRADLVSRWILAEASPLSLPDARWDTMVYGVRDCEQTLRSR